MTDRNARFNRTFLHFRNGISPDREHDLSDRGAAVRRMCNLLDARPGATELKYLRRLAVLRKVAAKLRRTGYGYLVPTLFAIAKNESRRGDSIERIRKRLGCSYAAAERRYYRHLRQLERMFGIGRSPSAR